MSGLPAAAAARYSQFPVTLGERKEFEGSLVTQIEGDFPGRSFGHVIDVPNFGQIYLATLKVEESDFDPSTQVPKNTQITLNMIEMQMGCLGSGTLTGGSGKTNGSTEP
jgi:hypothetical protein